MNKRGPYQSFTKSPQFRKEILELKAGNYVNKEIQQILLKKYNLNISCKTIHSIQEEVTHYKSKKKNQNLINEIFEQMQIKSFKYYGLNQVKLRNQVSNFIQQLQNERILLPSQLTQRLKQKAVNGLTKLLELKQKEQERALVQKQVDQQNCLVFLNVYHNQQNDNDYVSTEIHPLQDD